MNKKGTECLNRRREEKDKVRSTFSNIKAKEICFHVKRSVNHCLSVTLQNTFVDSITVHVS